MKFTIFSKKKNPFDFIYLLNFTILTFILGSSNCYVKIAFKYFPLYKYNETNPSTIFPELIQLKLYTILKIGDPQQTVEIPIVIDSNDFYITKYHISAFDKEPNYFKDLKFFEYINSKTLATIDYNQYTGDNFKIGEYCKDFIQFGETNKTYFEFYLPYDITNPESGGIGMQLNPRNSFHDATPNETRTFLKKLKDRNIIEDYCWTIFYNEKNNYVKEEEGFLLIGKMPDEIGEKLGYYPKNSFKKENFKKLNAEVDSDQMLNRFFYDEIHVYDKNNKLLNITFDTKGSLQVDLDFNNGGIKAPKNVLNYFEKEIFNDSISKNECFTEFSEIKKYKFFYCKNDGNIISKVKTKMPIFKFTNYDLDTVFEITDDDLFYQQGNFVYCLMYFESPDSLEKNGWNLGKPFLKKYQFTYNPSSKIIGFYINTGEKEKSVSLKTFIIVIIIVVVIAIAISAIVIKILLDKYRRKKRANELTDDEFEYTQKEDATDKLGVN